MNKIINIIYSVFLVLLVNIHSLHAQQKSTSGLVVDENDQPLIGVQVRSEERRVGKEC